MAKKRKLHMGPAIPTQQIGGHRHQDSHRVRNDKGAPYHLADPLAAFASAYKTRQTLNLLSGIESKNVSMNLPGTDPTAEAGNQEGAFPSQYVSKGSPRIRDNNLEDICSASCNIRHTTSRHLDPSEPQESPARPLLGNVPGAPLPTQRLQPSEVQHGLEQEPPADLVPPPSADGILHLLCKRPRHLKDQHANLSVLGSGMASHGPRHKPLLLKPKQQDYRQMFQARTWEAQLDMLMLYHLLASRKFASIYKSDCSECVGTYGDLHLHDPKVLQFQHWAPLQGSEDDQGYGAHERLLGTPMPKLSAPLLHTEVHTPIAATKRNRQISETSKDTFAANGRRQSQSSETSEELLSFQMDSQSSSPSGDSPSLKDRNPPIFRIRRTVEGPGNNPCSLSYVPRYPTYFTTPEKTHTFMAGLVGSYEGNHTSSGVQMGNHCAWHSPKSTRRRATSPLDMNMSLRSPESEDWLL